MAENWEQIAAEVAAGIASVGSTDAGYPVALRRVTVTGGSPYDPTSGTTTITYLTMRAVDTETRLRDVNGTLIGETRRTLLVGAVPGVVPTDDDQVAPGITGEDASEESAWLDIINVNVTAPAGVPVLYEIDLVT